MQIIININEEGEAVVETRGESTARPSGTSEPSAASDADAIDAGPVSAELAQLLEGASPASTTETEGEKGTTESRSSASPSPRGDFDEAIDVGSAPESAPADVPPPSERVVTESPNLGLDDLR